jgi:hypothetical protein
MPRHIVQSASPLEKDVAFGSDLTEPACGPIEFELRNVQMGGASLTGTAMVRNLQNKRVPRLNKNYDYVQFPSLLP